MKRALAVIGAVLVAGTAWFWFLGPCGTRKVAHDRERLRVLSDRWKDGIQLVSSTPIIALAGPLGRLQDVRQDTRELEVASCSEHAKNLLLRSMEIVLDSVTEVASTPLDRRDAARAGLGEKMNSAAEKLGFFNEELDHLEECTPLCDVPFLSALR